MQSLSPQTPRSPLVSLRAQLCDASQRAAPTDPSLGCARKRLVHVQALLARRPLALSAAGRLVRRAWQRLGNIQEGFLMFVYAMHCNIRAYVVYPPSQSCFGLRPHSVRSQHVEPPFCYMPPSFPVCVCVCLHVFRVCLCLCPCDLSVCPSLLSPFLYTYIFFVYSLTHNNPMDTYKYSFTCCQISYAWTTLYSKCQK